MPNSEIKRLSVNKTIEKKRRSSSSSSNIGNTHRDLTTSKSSSPTTTPSSIDKKKRNSNLHNKESLLDCDKQDAGELIDLSAYSDGPGLGPDDSLHTITDVDEEEEVEYKTKHPTGDKFRDKIRKLLADAMDKKDENIISNRQQIEIVANAIEQSMYNHFDQQTSQQYKAKYRDLSFNLKDPKNISLRTNILKRLIPLDQLISMSNQELANDDLKKTRKKVQERMTRDAQPSNKPVASTNQFKCGKCKQRKCTYFQMQTRSADEPLTTFVTCVNCGNRWKF